MRKRTPREPPTVYSVTSAPSSLRDDQQERMRRYLVSMGIRTVCFLLAVWFLVGLRWTVAGWAMVAGAVVLPYIAVVMANAGRENDEPGALGVTPAALPQIEQGLPPDAADPPQ